MTCLALPAGWEEHLTLLWCPHSSHPAQWSSARNRMYPAHLRATTEIPATWEGGGKAHGCFWSKGTREKLQHEILASTLMAQRPMARTALRTKSTSTSVAYSLSSARTCGDTTPMSAPGDTQGTAHPHRRCCLGTRRWAGRSFTATTHIQPNSAFEAHWSGYTGVQSKLLWLHWCAIQTSVGYTWYGLDKDKRWSWLFAIPLNKSRDKISPAKLKRFPFLPTLERYLLHIKL